MPVRVTSTAPSSSTETICPAATGASLMGDTDRDTVAMSESSAPSLTRKVKLSSP